MHSAHLLRAGASTLLPALLLALSTCAEDDPAETAGAGSPAATTARSDRGDPPVMHRLSDFELVDQDGAAFGRGDLAGKAWIADFIFTRCGQTCPAQTQQLAELQRSFLEEGRHDNVHLVSITVDPAHDTPEVLREYAVRAGADPSFWTFLTGNREAIWSLIENDFLLPVFDTEDDPTAAIVHSQQFVLVDREGRMRGAYDGLDAASVARLQQDLARVLAEPFESTPSLDAADAVSASVVAPQGDDERPLWEPRNVGPEGGDPANDVASEDGSHSVWVPAEVRTVPWLEERAKAQLATVERFEVFHDFRFTDRLEHSGIDFVNVIVEDSGKDYFGVHYDHGDGVAVADVDGDGLLDLYFANQYGANALYRNRGGGRFENVTEQAGVGVADRVSVACSFADVDNDGDPDLFVTTVRGGNLLFENTGEFKFEDVSKEAGVDYVGHSASGVFFDYDRDGLVDLFLCNIGDFTTEEEGPGGYYKGLRDAFGGHLFKERTELSILYRNLGNGKFEDVTRKTSLFDRSWSGDASPIDYNDDGWLDLYVLNMQGHDEFYENVGGKQFVVKSREVFPSTSWGAMGIKVLDYNNDGLFDIYTTDMHTDMVDYFYQRRRFWYAEKLKIDDMYPARFLATDQNHVRGNSFFENQGGGKFAEVSDRIGAENYWPWGLSVGDLNADGWQDAFVASSMNYPFRYGVNSLLLNNRGKQFLDSEFILGVEPRKDRRTSTLWFELDCDGADRNHPLAEGRKGKVKVWAALGTRSSVLFDLDEDGDLDIVTNDFNSAPMVLVSDLAEKTDLHYLKIDLVGKKSSRQGLGAVVTVKAGGLQSVQANDGKSGYFGQSVAPLYFGLGEAAAADEIRVRWPTGKTQVVEGPVAANQKITITEEE